ncbi:MAG: flagellar brake protein [Lachnospira sp.]
MYEPLAIGNKVEFVRKYMKGSDELNQKDTYVSQILDTNDEGIVCAMPIFEGRLIPIEIGTVLESYFYTAKGIYKGDCDVIDRTKEGGLYTLTITFRDAPKKFQRREFFRLDCTFEIAVKKFNEQETAYFNEKLALPETIADKEVRYIVIDISGGGIRMLSKEMFNKGALLELRFPLVLSGKTIVKRLAGRIIASNQSNNNNSIYDNRIQFVNISKDDSEDIIKFIFEQQRIMRKKERG